MGNEAQKRDVYFYIFTFPWLLIPCLLIFALLSQQSENTFLFSIYLSTVVPARSRTSCSRQFKLDCAAEAELHSNKGTQWSAEESMSRFQNVMSGFGGGCKENKLPPIFQINFSYDHLYVDFLLFFNARAQFRRVKQIINNHNYS